MASIDQHDHDDHDHDCLTVVSITKTVSVFPKVLVHPPKLLTLSNLDRQCPVHMYLVFFYKNDDHHLLLDSVFRSLKCGLEETLSVWYPAAGRLSLNPNDGNNKLNLWCNNKGAILVKADTQVKISDLGDLSQYNHFFEKLVCKPVFDGDFSQMPLLVAQVTKFGCGGYSIGLGMSHSVFDGPGAYDFMCAWASNSAINIKEDCKAIPELARLPVHDRGALLNIGKVNVVTKLMLQNSNDDPGAVLVTRAAAVDHLYQLIMQAAASIGSCLINQIDDHNNYVHKTFHLSGALIENLKRDVFGGGDDHKGISFSCSSFEAVAAHLWKARSKALGVKKETMVCLQFAVDARNKVVPPLPQGFSGNAYVLASVALTAAQVEQATHKAIVEKIREAKRSVTNHYVKAYMEGVAGPVPQTSLPPLKELTLVSDWTKMPFHKVGFLGEAAAAAYVSPLVSPIPQVAYFMQNPNDKKGIDMRIGLLPQHLNAFTRYFLTNTEQ